MSRIAEKDQLIETLMNPQEGVESHVLVENRKLKRDVEMWKSRTTKLTEELADDPTARSGYAASDQALLSKARSLERENLSLKSKILIDF